MSNNPNDPSSSIATEFINVLVVATDLSFAKQVQVALQSIANENPEKMYRVFPGVSKEKIIECIEKYDLHTVLIEEEMFFDKTPQNYFNDFKSCLKKNSKNEDTPMILATLKTDSAWARKMVRMGWRDVLIKPLDRSLFLQKMNIYNVGRPIMKDNALFIMEAKKEVDLAFQYETKTISEFGMKISSPTSIPAGTVLTVKSDFLTEPISALVLDSVKSSDTEYAINLLFIGVTPGETTAVRRFIRQEYADGKKTA